MPQGHCPQRSESCNTITVLLPRRLLSCSGSPVNWSFSDWDEHLVAVRTHRGALARKAKRWYLTEDKFFAQISRSLVGSPWRDPYVRGTLDRCADALHWASREHRQFSVETCNALTTVFIIRHSKQSLWAWLWSRTRWSPWTLQVDWLTYLYSILRYVRRMVAVYS